MFFPHSPLNIVSNVLAWDANGGDHEGADWTPTGTIMGVHTNVGVLTISSTVYVNGATGTLSISAVSANISGTLDASGYGSAGGVGTCHGVNRTSGTSGGSGGGGYGDWGGNGSGGTWTNGCQAPYGSNTAPVSLGSGGGNAPSAPGGAGGGAIKIQTSGNLVLTGTLRSNGLQGGGSSNNRGGGGSGGSIYLIVGGEFSGNGVINAKGGNGSNGGSTYGGGGSGGRVAVHYGTNVFSGTLYQNTSYPYTPGIVSPGTSSGNGGWPGSVYTVQEVSGSIITNVPSSYKAVLSSNWTTNVSTAAQTGTKNIGLLKDAGYRIATADISFASNSSWASLVAGSTSNSSLFYYPGAFYSLPGHTGSTFTLYIPKGTGNVVSICPNATNIGEVIDGCGGQYYLETSISPNLTEAEEGGVNYYKVASFNNGGGYSVVGGKIVTVPSEVEVVKADDWSKNIINVVQEGSQELGVENTSDIKIATFEANFSTTLDWSLLTAKADNTKSVFHYPGGITALPGATSSSYTLYITKGAAKRLGICPGASTLSEVNKNCAGLYYLDEISPNVTVATEDGVEYWKISGLTSTGGMSLFDFDLKDTMTRLQMGIRSDHTIEFGTENGLLVSGETIELTFDPDSLGFDLTDIDLGDIDLEDDGVDVTLGAVGVSTWGVDINTTTDSITFTAPTSGTGYIAAGSIIVVKIGINADSGSNQVENPGSVGEYEIHFKNTNSSGVETGEVTVPVVDDDTVNVTSYLDTMLVFDIDTSEVNEDSDAEGGVNPCDSHGGVSDNIGYVVDVGEMTYTIVNNSGDTVMHADGELGEINSIYFDLATNADGGAGVSVKSLYGSMYKDATNVIPSVINTGSGVTISAGSGLYGLRHVTNSAAYGTWSILGDYSGVTGVYGQALTSTTSMFNTGGNPISGGRLELEVGVSPDTMNGTGTYTDELTFVASATF